MGRTLKPLVATIYLAIPRCVVAQLTSLDVCLCTSSLPMQNPEPSFCLGGGPALSFPLP